MIAPRALLLCWLVPTFAAAEEPALVEILVTGERQVRSLLDTDSSLRVATGEELEQQSGAWRIEQVLAMTPGIQLGSGGEGPAIRGQDSTGVLRDLPGFLGGARPRATVQVDGRAISFNEFIFGVTPLWDVSQVEVYRSPQTTTQGRNSIAGAIFIDTRDPEYHWGGSARLLGGSYGTRQGSFTLTGPLVKDQIALRLAGDFRGSRTSSKLGDFMADADPNRDEYALLRAKLLVEPEALPGLRLLTTYVHSESERPQIEGVVAPFPERNDPQPGYGVFSITVDSLTSVARYPLTESLESTTSVSWGSVHVVRHSRPGLGEAETDSRDLALESMLHWRAAPSLRLLGGLHLLRSVQEQDINLAAVLGTGTFGDRQYSLGVFGDAQWQFAPRLSLTAGLRHQRDSQRRLGSIAGSQVLLPIDYDGGFEAWLPKLSLSYELGRTARIGLMVQRAFNPGGTSLNLDTGEQTDFGAEKLWNYELILRAGFAEGRGSLSANVFHVDFDDAQRAQPRVFNVPGGGVAFWSEIVNVPAARSTGVEAEIAWQLEPRLHLRAGAGLLDTRIVRTTDPLDPLLRKEFARAPHFTGTLALAWQPAAHWRLSAQARRNAGYFSNDANASDLRIDPSTVVDLSAAYDRLSWSVSAYARNLFDKFYMTTLFTPVRGTAGDPREFGLGAAVRF
jgi:iron complex outermembrane receptor protein